MNPPEVKEAHATLIPEDEKEMALVVQQNALQVETAQSLQAAFAPLFSKARDVITKSRTIVVTQADQKMEIAMARACRLELKAIRVAGEKKRKETKEESLRRSKAIDGFYNILDHLVVAEETRLEDQEKFAERQEAARKAVLVKDRSAILTGIAVDPMLYNLADMSEETFQTLVEGTRLARAEQAERARRAEADRIEREKAVAEERERMRLENERLKREEQERLEKARAEHEIKMHLHITRVAQMEPYVSPDALSRLPSTFYGEMTEEQFAAVWNDAKAKKAERDRLEAQRAEAEKRRLAAEEKARIEREAAAARQREIEAENARRLAEQKRLADEAAAVERKRVEAERKAAEEKARAERQKAEKKAAEDRAAREKAEAELKAARDAEEGRKAAEAEAARRAAAAPDRDKLLTYANAIRAVDLPDFTTPEAKAIATTILASRGKFIEWIESKAAAL